MLTLSEVADLLISPHAEQLCHGNYTNRRNIRGYYVQLKCGNHWCKAEIHVYTNSSGIEGNWAEFHFQGSW